MKIGGLLLTVSFFVIAFGGNFSPGRRGLSASG